MIKNVQLCNSLSKVSVPHSQNYYMKNIYKAGEFHFRTAMPYHIIHNNTTLNVYMMLKKRRSYHPSLTKHNTFQNIQKSVALDTKIV